ncbi:PH domain-containing protein [Candidatus Giovannonibacteria bacterium]|nr:PH domain-containing protein [Candidatus Giovannonibacteria bacterium]
MLNLDPEEKVVLIMHHHWIALLMPVFVLVIFVVAPWVLLPFILNTYPMAELGQLYYFILSIWYLITLLLALSFWIDYYLDALVITDKRIMYVNQSGLFRHIVSEFRMERVQDVTIEVPNFLGTIFHFGNINIQTAGEVNFSINEVPRPHIARDLILKHAKLTDKV